MGASAGSGVNPKGEESASRASYQRRYSAVVSGQGARASSMSGW